MTKTSKVLIKGVQLVNQSSVAYTRLVPPPTGLLYLKSVGHLLHHHPSNSVNRLPTMTRMSGDRSNVIGPISDFSLEVNRLLSSMRLFNCA